MLAGDASTYGQVHALHENATVHGRMQVSVQVYSVSGPGCVIVQLPSWCVQPPDGAAAEPKLQPFFGDGHGAQVGM